MILLYSNPVSRKFEQMISVAVRMKNESSALSRMSKSVRFQVDVPDLEFVFLDSESTDNSVDIAKNDANYIYSLAAEEFQFGRSCNQILRACSGDFVLLISGHVYFESSSALKKALEVLNSDPLVGAVYFGQSSNGLKGVDFSSYENLFLRKRFPPSNYVLTELGSTPPVSNAAALIRKKVWDEIKFPEVTASEDYIWAKNIVEKGWRIYYLGGSRAIHNHNETPDQIYKRVYLNKISKFGRRMMPAKALFSFLKIFFGLLLIEKEYVVLAFGFAFAHARAYLK